MALKTAVHFPHESTQVTVSGESTWNNPQAVFINDDITAATTVIAGDSLSSKLRVFDFGFTPAEIPVDAEILSAVLTIYGYASNDAVVDESIKISHTNQIVEIGDNVALADSWPTVINTATIRGGGRWGLDANVLTPAELHDTFFGFSIQVNNTASSGGASAIARINYITLEVWYEVANTVTEEVAVTISNTDIKNFLCINSVQYDTQLTSIINWWEPILDSRLKSGLSVTESATVFLGKLLYICYFAKNVLPAKLINAFAGRREITQGNVKIVTQTSDKASFDFLVEAERILKPYYTTEFADNGMSIQSNNTGVALEFILDRTDTTGTVITAGTMKEW